MLNSLWATDTRKTCCENQAHPSKGLKPANVKAPLTLVFIIIETRHLLSV